jgi:hypothetical protein
MAVRTRMDVDVTDRLLRELLDQAEHEQRDGRVTARAAGMVASTLVDTLAVRYADAKDDPNDLFDIAEQLVASLDLQPTGSETSSDPDYFGRAKQATAILLARLWINGMLLGPVPVDAWPNAELARLLLRAVEQHGDRITLDVELGRLRNDDDPGIS